MPVPAPVFAPPGGSVARLPSAHLALRRLVGRLALMAFTLGPIGSVARSAAAADPAGPLEYRVKAGFLFNFARFVEWPPAALPPDQPFHLALVVPPAVYQTIVEALAEKKVGGRALAISLLDPEKPGSGPPPHAIFVHQGAKVSAERLQALFPDRPILIIGESPGFAAAGGMIGFALRGDSFRFQVNLVAARRARLQLSSQLESLAEIVQPKP